MALERPRSRGGRDAHGDLCLLFGLLVRAASDVGFGRAGALCQRLSHGRSVLQFDSRGVRHIFERLFPGPVQFSAKDARRSQSPRFLTIPRFPRIAQRDRWSQPSCGVYRWTRTSCHRDCLPVCGAKLFLYSRKTADKNRSHQFRRGVAKTQGLSCLSAGRRLQEDDGGRK